MHFDQWGNVVGNNYIRKVERKDGKLVNAVVKTYPKISASSGPTSRRTS